MDNPALTVTLAAAINLAPRALSPVFSHAIGRVARDALDGLPEGVESSPAENVQDHGSQSTVLVRQIFASIRMRLATAWSLGLLTTLTLVLSFPALALAALIFGLVLYVIPLILACLSAASLIILIVKRPYRRSFSAILMLQRLEIVLAGLETEWAKYASLKDPAERLQCTCKTNREILEEFAKLAD